MVILDIWLDMVSYGFRLEMVLLFIGLDIVSLNTEKTVIEDNIN